MAKSNQHAGRLQEDKLLSSGQPRRLAESAFRAAGSAASPARAPARDAVVVLLLALGQLAAVSGGNAHSSTSQPTTSTRPSLLLQGAMRSAAAFTSSRALPIATPKPRAADHRNVVHVVADGADFGRARFPTRPASRSMLCHLVMPTGAISHMKPR